MKKSTSSGKKIVEAALALYDRLVPRRLYVRRFYIDLEHVQPREEAATARQMDMFCDGSVLEREEAERRREARLQQTALWIREKYGKNALLKGVSYLQCATMRARNGMVGGHAAGECSNGKI